MTAGGAPVRDRSALVVLAGGGSRRMGRPKAFLEVGGREMLDRVLEAGLGACGEVVLVVGAGPGPYGEALRRYGWEATGADPATFRRAGVPLRLVRDRTPGLGPVAGLAAGLAAARRPLCFAAACDLPFLEGSLAIDLLARLDASDDPEEPREEAPARAVVPVADGRRQPLASAYTAGCAAAARRCVETGDRAMDAFLARLDAVREAPADGLAGPASAFLNVNRPDDLRAARRIARRPAGGPDAGAGSAAAGGGDR